MTSDNEFHKRVGLCITAWATLEEQLFNICHSSLGSSKVRAAIVYFKIPGLDARLSLIDELVISVLPKPIREDGGHQHKDAATWAALCNRIRDQLSTRRRIAHHPVREQRAESLFDVQDIHALTDFHTLSSLELYMSENEQLRGKGRSGSLHLGDLQRHYMAVTSLADQLGVFHRDVLVKHI
jgi:hypothetical protein